MPVQHIGVDFVAYNSEGAIIYWRRPRAGSAPRKLGERS